MSTLIHSLEPIQTVFEWVAREAARRGLAARLHTELAREEDQFLYLPVHLDGDQNALAVADALQNLEDSWNDREPEPARRLLLIPTKD